MNRLKNTVEFWCKNAESTLILSVFTVSLSLIPTARKDSEKKQ